MISRNKNADAQLAIARSDNSSPRSWNHLAISFAAALSLTVSASLISAPAAHAAGTTLAISQAELASFGKRLSLTSAQRPAVNTITVALVKENAGIFRKYGIDERSCSGLGPLKLSSLNAEINGAYNHARGRLSQVLSSSQMRKFASIYAERRQATKKRIMCGTTQARR